MNNQNSSQDLSRQLTGSAGSIGKKLVGKPGRKLAGKLAKKLKKLAMKFLKKVVLSILKALLAFIGPMGCLVILVIFIIVVLIASIPFADWFLDGGQRSAAQKQKDLAYQEEYIDIANNSVSPIFEEDADKHWKEKLSKQVKPSYGIPIALVRYDMLSTGESFEDYVLPEPGDQFEGLKPSFDYVSINDDKGKRRIEKTCTWEETVAEKKDTYDLIMQKTTETYDCEISYAYIYKGLSTEPEKVEVKLCSEVIDTKTENIVYEDVTNVSGYPNYPSFSDGESNIIFDEGNTRVIETVQFSKRVNSKNVEKTVTREEKTTDYEEFTLDEHRVMSHVDSIYGSIDIEHATKYYPGGTYSYDPNAWEKVRTEEYSKNGKDCVETIYEQYGKTSIDERVPPILNRNDKKLENYLIAKGVKEGDLKIIYEFIAAADKDFDVGRYNSSPIQSGGKGYVPGDYEFDGETVDGWVWPVANDRTITSHFGPRWGTMHYGIDLGGSRANNYPVLAAYDGKVILAQYSPTYGNWVIIAHDNGLTTRYAHMWSYSVNVGDEVRAGDQIGVLGSTGDSTGPHLHFEILRPGSASPFDRSKYHDKVYDPYTFLSRILEAERQQRAEGE